jgi:hypothetical protein
MLAEQSATMTVRSLLRDSLPSRRTPPPVPTPRSHVERPRPPAPARAPAASAPAPDVPPLVDSGARTTVVVVEKRERETEPVKPTAPATPILPVEPVRSAGGYEVSAFGPPMPGAPVGPRPVRRHRWTIAIFATGAMLGMIAAAGGFYLALREVSPVAVPTPPVTAQAPPVTEPAPPVAEPTAPVAASTPPVAEPTASVTELGPPDTVTPSLGSPTFPGEPPVQEEPPATPRDTPEPTPRKKAPGTLRVQTTPWAWVTIGKQKQQTPGAEFSLAPGRYTVRLEFPTLGITEKKKVAIESRKTFTLNIDREVENIDKEVVEKPDKGEEEGE